MTEQIMQDPNPERIEGQKIVKHQFDHGIDYKINLSHVMLVGLLLVGVYFYQTRIASDSKSTPQATVENPAIIDQQQSDSQ
jgi:hypothetical protein